jgi:hypothetical protein
MTNRTYQFFGQGFGTDPVSVDVALNGNPVYSGTVPTVDQPFSDNWYSPDLYRVLFTIESPVEFAGTLPISVSVNSGSGLKLAFTLANYCWVKNPVFTPAQGFTQAQFEALNNNIRSTESLNIFTALANPPFTQEEIDKLTNPETTQFEFNPLLISHNVSPYVPGGPDNFKNSFVAMADPRTNVTLDGVPIQPPNPRPPEQGGMWTWSIYPGSVLTFDLITAAGAV